MRRTGANPRVASPRSAGFTLVEMLLALTLMGMLMALVYGGMRASTRAADRGQTILEDSSRIRMAHQFVHNQLNQMMPLVFEENEDRSERSVFVGSADYIRFVAPMPGYLGFGGPQVQELAIVPGPGDKLELVLYHALLQGFEEPLLYERDPIPLIENIEHAEFQFLGYDEQGLLGSWSTTWDDPATLPASVSLDIEFGEEVYIRWPLLIASVRTDPAAFADLAGELAAEPAYNATIRDMINRRSRD